MQQTGSPEYGVAKIYNFDGVNWNQYGADIVGENIDDQVFPSPLIHMEIIVASDP